MLNYDEFLNEIIANTGLNTFNQNRAKRYNQQQKQQQQKNPEPVPDSNIKSSVVEPIQPAKVSKIKGKGTGKDKTDKGAEVADTKVAGAVADTKVVNTVTQGTVNGKAVNGPEIVNKIKELITNLINKLKPTATVEIPTTETVPPAVEAQK